MALSRCALVFSSTLQVVCSRPLSRTARQTLLAAASSEQYTMQQMHSCSGAQGAQARLNRAEQALEALLDAQLHHQQRHPNEDGCSSSDDFAANVHDDYIDSDAAESDSDVCVTAASDSHSVGTTNKAVRGRHKGLIDACGSAQEPAQEAVIDSSDPPSFSQVDLSRPASELRARFPLFPVSPVAASPL